MVRDFYAQNYDITLRNYARPNDWNADDLDIIGHSHSKEGFVQVPDWTLTTLNPGDVLCMAIGASVANHMAIYVGDNLIAHHMRGAMSNVELLRPFWRKVTCYVARHPEVPLVSLEKPKSTLMEILNEKYNIKAIETIQPETD